jgi:hypothetical protein
MDGPQADSFKPDQPRKRWRLLVPGPVVAVAATCFAAQT